MKVASYDNIEVARELLNIINWCLECEQIERRKNDSESNNNIFSYSNAWNEYKKSDEYQEINKIIKSTGKKSRMDSKPTNKNNRTRKNCS